MRSHHCVLLFQAGFVVLEFCEYGGCKVMSLYKNRGDFIVASILLHYYPSLIHSKLQQSFKEAHYKFIPVPPISLTSTMKFLIAELLFYDFPWIRSYNLIPWVLWKIFFAHSSAGLNYLLFAQEIMLNSHSV